MAVEVSQQCVVEMNEKGVLQCLGVRGAYQSWLKAVDYHLLRRRKSR